MKSQPKRFVVEVKRGTSRAAFSSPDAAFDKFSSAEATLFGGGQKPAEAEPQSSAQPRGRILESLIEPPAPIVDDGPERPRRGRKPGSKNKPKPPAIAAASPTATRAGASGADGQGGATAPESSHPPARSPDPVQAVAAPGTGETEAGPIRRARLRERSIILKRYVLGLAPRPGQPGALRARRLARAAR